MSATPIETFQQVQYKSSEDQASSCIKCRKSQKQSGSSSQMSSQQVSQSFSIELKANDLHKEPLKLKYLQNEVRRLAVENQLLAQKNKQLLSLLQGEGSQKKLKGQLREKQREISLLKAQMNPKNYIKSHSNSNFEAALQFKQKLQTQDYNQRIKSSSKSKHQRKGQFFSQEIINKSHINEVMVIKDKFKIQKVQYQKHVCLLQQKLLIYEREMNWLLNLVSKIIALGQKLGFIFKEKPISQKWGIKKQAKESWRYLKHVLNYFLFIQ